MLRVEVETLIWGLVDLSREREREQQKELEQSSGNLQLVCLQSDNVT